MTDATPPDDSFTGVNGSSPRRADASAPTSRRAARDAQREQVPSQPTAAQPSAPQPTRPPTQSPPVYEMFQPDPSGQGPRSPKGKTRLGCGIVLALILLLLGGVVVGGFWVWTTYETQIREFMGWEEPKDFDAGIAEGEVLVTISEGDGGQQISQTLYDQGVTKTSSAFYDMLVDTGATTTFYPGTYQLQLKMTSAAALEALEDPANKLENSAQLPEGLTVAQTLTRLSESTSLSLEDLNAAVANPSDYSIAADSLEGWLFPATYTFEPGVTAPQVIQTLVDRTVQSLDAASVPVDQRQRILTIASIIQREAGAEADFYKVSRVIQNRLDDGMLLQMDSTAQYGYGEMHDGTVSSSAEALSDDNAWNTYVRSGLPAGPIANPGDAAIDAAMHPADGDWLYFVTVNLNTGETEFTNNLADHEAAVAKWRAWCTENPDAGC
ncbi:UPF0755 protein [Microbacterium halimionae]|uniref:Endolytic murein transglycosylase n=1 Tax=Microbacterium halimionae TaxID=1526413 RepID=A0A7W3PLK6_9MICO|nr:endolytic transglycosylase MltG [Microbacterium halimionae]MBA8816116.1 UPF0755 protein [Microbacterium halimionae]NII96318.1 UPF0755 protein [Microbacterium halimionae]